MQFNLENGLSGIFARKTSKVAPILPVPILPIIEKRKLITIGPFTQVEGTIMRSKALIPERCGDAILQNGKAICVIDASAPHEIPRSQYEQTLYESGIVFDFQTRLSDIFSGVSFESKRFMKALSEVLTSNNRNWFSGHAEFGLSTDFIYYDDNKQLVGGHIGTGALYIEEKKKTNNGDKFYTPFPPSGSKYAGNKMKLEIFNLSSENVRSVVMCTDGIDLDHFSPTLSRPITEFIAPHAKEATIVRLQR